MLTTGIWLRVLTDWNAEMIPMMNPRFALRKVTEREWVILDHQYGQNDSRQTVACVFEAGEGEVEVTWLQGLPLPTKYPSVARVFEDVVKLCTKSRAERPIPIAHVAPNV